MSSASTEEEKTSRKRSKTDETTAHATSYLGAFVIGAVHAMLGHNISGSTSERCIVSSISNSKHVTVHEALSIVALELLGSPKPVQKFSPLRVSDQMRKIFDIERKWSHELSFPIDVIFSSKTIGFSDEPKPDSFSVKLSTARPCAYLPEHWTVLCAKPLSIMQSIVTDISGSDTAMRSILPLAFHALMHSGPRHTHATSIAPSTAASAAGAAGGAEAGGTTISVGGEDEAARAYCFAAKLLKEEKNHQMKSALARICQETTKLGRHVFVARDEPFEIYKSAIGEMKRMAEKHVVAFCPSPDSRFDSCVACGVPEEDGETLVRPLVIGIKSGSLASNISGNFRVMELNKHTRVTKGDLGIEVKKVA
jgi:hypothetical protein